MPKLEFKQFPNTIGKMESNNVELTIYAQDTRQLKKYLTVKDKGAEYNLKRVSISRNYWLQRATEITNLDKKSEVILKIQGFEKEMETLKAACLREFFADNDDGSLSVPAGLWWVCDKIENDRHLNTTLIPYYLEGLRDYQIETLTELYKYNRATAVLATGLGKTHCIMSIALAGVKSGKRTMIVEPTVYLVEQTFYKLKELHDNTTAIGGDFGNFKLGADILVVTADSAYKYADMFDIVIIDESHHSSAQTWISLLCMAVKAAHVYNFTATPIRGDGLEMGIHAFGGPIVYEKDERWGIASKWLATPEIVCAYIEPKNRENKVAKCPDFINKMTAYGRLVTKPNVLEFIKKLAEAALAKNRRVIVVFRTVKAGLEFKKYCEPFGLEFNVASAARGKITKAPLTAFRLNKTDLLVTNDKLISEGVDIPNADALINVVQNSGEGTTKQMLGRILRPAPEKKNCVFVDITLANCYKQFDTASHNRRKTFSKITDDIKTIGG